MRQPATGAAGLGRSRAEIPAILHPRAAQPPLYLLGDPGHLLRAGSQHLRALRSRVDSRVRVGSDTTRSNYKFAMASWDAFLAGTGVSAPRRKVSHDTWECFHAWLAERYKWATARTYLSAVRTELRVSGIRVPEATARTVRMMRNLRAEPGKAPSPKQGLSPSDLRALHALCKAEGDTRLWCAVMVATYGLLRSESYTLSQVYRSSRVCRIGDIIATEEGMCLSLFGIKGQPGTAFDVQLARTGGWACVVTAIERHLRRAEPTTFLLESSPGIPWGYHQFLGALKRACGLVGLDPKSIGTHSLRRTGAQLLERLKIVPESAKPKMGRWKPRSKVYKKYTKLPSEESLPKAERLAYGKAMTSLLEG